MGFEEVFFSPPFFDLRSLLGGGGGGGNMPRKLSFVIVALLLTGLSSAKIGDFASWKVSHRKSYESANEEITAQNNFEKNSQYLLDNDIAEALVEKGGWVMFKKVAYSTDQPETVFIEICDSILKPDLLEEDFPMEEILKSNYSSLAGVGDSLSSDQFRKTAAFASTTLLSLLIPQSTRLVLIAYLFTLLVTVISLH